MSEGIQENHEAKKIERGCIVCRQIERIEREVSRGEHRFDEEFKSLIRGVMDPTEHTWKGSCQYAEARGKIASVSDCGYIDEEHIERVEYDVNFTLVGDTAHIDVTIDPPVVVNEEVTIEV